MRRAVYIVILAVAAVFYPLYRDILSLVILAALIALPFFSLAEMLLRKRKIAVSGLDGSRVIYKGESINEEICIKNSSVFPVSGEISLVSRSLPDGGEEEYSADIAVPSRSEDSVTVSVSSLHSGVCETEIKYIRIQDMLGLFSAKIHSDGKSSAYVIPHISDEYEDEARAIKASRISDSDSEDDLRPTTSPGDVIDFREYRPGDRTTLIHHKLSARFDKDIVKIMGTSGDQKFILCADIENADPDTRDEILTHVLSCAYYLDSFGADVYVSAPDELIEINGVDMTKASCALAEAKSVPDAKKSGAVNIVVSGG